MAIRQLFRTLFRRHAGSEADTLVEPLVLMLLLLIVVAGSVSLLAIARRPCDPHALPPTPPPLRPHGRLHPGGAADRLLSRRPRPGDGPAGVPGPHPCGQPRSVGRPEPAQPQQAQLPAHLRGVGGLRPQLQPPRQQPGHLHLPPEPLHPPFRAATGSSTCNAGASNQFWILVPVLPESSELSGTTHTPSYRSIHYFLDPSDTTRLMRQGPRILASGRLDVSGPDNTDGASDAPTLVLDGISSFTPLISNDCRSLTLTVELSVGEVFGATMERTSRFRTRVKESIN